MRGQYVYAIIMPQPTPETIVATIVKQPGDMGRASFRELLVQRHIECDVALVETACVAETPATTTLPRIIPSLSEDLTLLSFWRVVACLRGGPVSLLRLIGSRVAGTLQPPGPHPEK